VAGKIFLNYRRGDDPGFTQALDLRLEDEFLGSDLFMDVEGHIKPGDDFVEVLKDQVAATDVLLATFWSRSGCKSRAAARAARHAGWLSCPVCLTSR